MSARGTINLALILVIISLILVAVYEPGRQPANPHPLLVIDPKTVKIIKIHRKQGEDIVLEKRKRQWWVTKPLEAAADPTRVRQIIRIAETPSEADYAVAPHELAKFNLARPPVSLSFDGQTLDFGGTDSIYSRRYVLANGRLHLVTDTFYGHLVAKAFDYVDKKLLNDTQVLNALVLPALQIRLDEKDQWTSHPALRTPAQMFDIINAWQSTRALSLSKFSFPDPGLESITLGFKHQAPITFTVLQKEPQLFLARTDLGLVYHIDAQTGKNLVGPRPSKGIKEPGNRASNWNAKR